MKNLYTIGAYITGVLVFMGIWLYALASWGFLIGLMAGWIPALIGGFLAGLLWPLVALFVIFILANLD